MPAYSCPISLLPAGVTGFALLDSDLNILSERLYFHLPASACMVPDAELSAPSYTVRERVCAHFPWPEEVSDGDAVLAVSVVDGASACSVVGGRRGEGTGCLDADPGMAPL